MESDIEDQSVLEFTRKCVSSEENINRLKEYNDQYHIGTQCLLSDIDITLDRLDKTMNNQSKFMNLLEEWRIEAHEIIDNFCKSKQDEYMKMIKEEIDLSKEALASINYDIDASTDYIDWAKNIIKRIHQQIDEFEKIQLKFSSLKLDDSLIVIPSSIFDLNFQPTLLLKELFTYSSLDFDKNQSENKLLDYFETAQQTLKVESDYWYSLSSNETYLLISEKSNLCLIDESLNIIKKKSFINIRIKDICWSKILSRFIIITPKEIYIVDDKLISFELCTINTINNYRWERGTSTNKTLFISTFGENPIIVEYNLLPSIQLNKRWQLSMFSQDDYLIINDIESNESFIGLILENNINNQTHFEIRSNRSFELINSIDLGKGWGYRCSNLNHTYWIIVDSYNNRIILNDNYRNILQIENYSIKPCNVVHWNQNKFVLRTIEHINIHVFSP